MTRQPSGRPRTCARLDLASVLAQWAAGNPPPYVGLHWPKTDR